MSALCKHHRSEWEQCLDLRIRPQGVALGGVTGYDVSGPGVRDRYRVRHATWANQVRTSQAIAVRACTEGCGCSLTAPVQPVLFEAAA